ncbi:MAG: OmpA family protein [Myxococcales bacterium]|nr:OmpA family protein [Myxococcales bacterium]
MVLFILSAAANAQQVTNGDVPNLNAQTFRPSIDGRRMLWVDDAMRNRSETLFGRALLQFVDQPLVYISEDDRVTGLVNSIWQLDAMIGGQLGPVRLGLDLPMYLLTTSDVGGAQSGLGDISLDAKGTILDMEDRPVGLALNGRLWLPTSTVDTALGNDGLAWELAGIATTEVGDLLLSGNVGLQGRPESDLENIRLNDYFVGRLGAGYAFSERAGAALELASLIPFSAPLSNSAGSPLEVLGSGYGYPGEGDVVVRGGIGAGITPGIGSPDLRLLLGVGYEPRPVAGDLDGDGLVAGDECPTQPEDMDDWQDSDGCPDIDNDDDGILDAADQCMNDPEDFDTYKDDDGCPERALVRIQVVDAVTQEEVGVARITVADENGEGRGGVTPFAMGIDDGKYQVIAKSAGYEDGIVDLTVENGPPVDLVVELQPKETGAVVSRDRIDLRDTVLFETNSATIKPLSYPLLEEAIQILEDYPEIRKLRIEGHTDERGPDEYNLQLSKDRAASVLAYFVESGMDAGRLTSEGYGETKPVDPASTPEAWAKNRRVDFFIAEWDDSATVEDQ